MPIRLFLHFKSHKHKPIIVLIDRILKVLKSQQFFSIAKSYFFIPLGSRKAGRARTTPFGRAMKTLRLVVSQTKTSPAFDGSTQKSHR